LSESGYPGKSAGHVIYRRRFVPLQNSRAKKTPLGVRGIRVIVVVANSVSVSALGLWWIIVVVFTAQLIFIVIYCSSS
jgi:hypothetical protein